MKAILSYFSLRGIIFLLFLLIAQAACNTQPPAEKRAARATLSTGEILVGVVYTSAYSNFFLEGVNMAVQEINERGGVLGRHIRTIVRDDRSNPVIARNVARDLAENKDVVAVIGHENSEAAVSALAVYEEEGIVFISYGATSSKLILYGSDYTLRNIPDDNTLAAEIARRISSEQLPSSKNETQDAETDADTKAEAETIKSIAVFYERDPSHRTFSEKVKKALVSQGVQVTGSRSFFKGDHQFKELISGFIREFDFEAAFITASLPEAAILVKQLREMDVNCPIFGSMDMDSPDLWAIAGKAAEGIVVPTVFNAEYPKKETRSFSNRFESTNGFKPDTWAAQGYDAMSVLAHAIAKGESTSPIVINTTLRFIENWNGVTGTYSFTPAGNIEGKDFFFKQMENGEFVFPDHGDAYQSDLFNYIEDYSLRLPLSDPITSLDPGLAANSADVEIAEQLFLGLTEIDSKDYSPVPKLASYWRTNTDCTLFIFFLRQARWTDGSPVTAQDVAFAVRRNILPETKAPDAKMLYILKNARSIHEGKIKDISELGVYAPDDYTVVFKLESPAAYFPALTTLGVYRPLPSAVFEKHKELWTDPENIVTNGPYRLDIYEAGVGMLLKKNPDYFNAGRVLIPEVRYYVIRQPSLGLAMYENNELDIIGSTYIRIPFDELSHIKVNPMLKDEYFEYPHFCTYTYAFNTKRPPVDDARVRRAISAAIDRAMLIETQLDGSGEPASTCTRPPIYAFPPPEAVTSVGFDPVQARKWLAQAGYPDGKGFPEITIFHPASSFHTNIARNVKAHIEHYLNIPVALKGEDDDAAYDEIVTTGNPPHIFRSKICAAYSNADSFLSQFDPSAPFYRTRWENEEFQEMIQQGRKPLDEEKLKAVYTAAETLLCGQAAVAIPLYYEIYNSMVKPRVKGWRHMPLGGQHVAEWWIEK